MKDLHVHTTFSDGKNTPEEMLLAAVEKGLDTIGFSDHSYTDFDEAWCMPEGGPAAYRAEITRLKEKYASVINVLCGIEQEYYTNLPAEGYDYVIGSVHYVLADGVYLPVDWKAEKQIEAADAHFGGDLYAFAEAYFDTVGRVVEKTNADIIGHFDLVSKFNEGGRLFDETHPRYRKAWMRAADKLLETGKRFEINTGAMGRGYRSEPYPNAEMREYIKARGGKFILSGDCHRTDTIAYAFERFEGAVEG